MKRPAQLLAVSGFALIVGCAPQTAPAAAAAASPQQCFSAKSINSFHAIGDESVDVVVGTRRVYRLDLAGACTDIRWTNAVAVRTLGGSSWICRGVDAEVIVPSPSGTQRCLVTSVRQLSDAEARALRYYR
jgi:uncharacterized protein DUF6491